jgi:hypothetical protein
MKWEMRMNTARKKLFRNKAKLMRLAAGLIIVVGGLATDWMVVSGLLLFILSPCSTLYFRRRTGLVIRQIFLTLLALLWAHRALDTWYAPRVVVGIASISLAASSSRLQDWWRSKPQGKNR